MNLMEMKRDALAAFKRAAVTVQSRRGAALECVKQTFCCVHEVSDPWQIAELGGQVCVTVPITTLAKFVKAGLILRRQEARREVIRSLGL